MLPASLARPLLGIQAHLGMVAKAPMGKSNAQGHEKGGLSRGGGEPATGGPRHAEDQQELPCTLSTLKSQKASKDRVTRAATMPGGPSHLPAPRWRVAGQRRQCPKPKQAQRASRLSRSQPKACMVTIATTTLLLQAWLSGPHGGNESGVEWEC